MNHIEAMKRVAQLVKEGHIGKALSAIDAAIEDAEKQEPVDLKALKLVFLPSDHPGDRMPLDQQKAFVAGWNGALELLKKQEPIYTTPPAEPVQEPVARMDALKDAFFEGFTSVETYNDSRLNSPEEAWAKYKPPVIPPAAPVQEPVAWMYDWLCDGKLIQDWIARKESEIPRLLATNIQPLYTTPPAAPAQEPCSKCHGLGYYDEGHENDDGSMSGGNYVECEKCKPPTAPVQEPVGEWVDGRGDPKRIAWKPGYVANASVGDKLYTTPPAARRQWVGLDWLPEHKCGLHLSHNEHRDVYETVEQFYDADDFISPNEWHKAVAEDSVWVLHWYPNTPVGFNRIAASTLEAIQAKLKEENT